MDSINKNQLEENFKSLAGKEAIEKLQQMGEDATCFFCTNIKSGERFSARPMAVQEIDDDGNFWFLSADDSDKNHELQHDAAVQLLFQKSSYTDFFTVYGSAEVSKDKDKISELWKPIMKAWFTEGKDDPRITVIKIVVSEGYYWDTKHSKLIAMIKTAAGALVGETFDDSIEGEVRL